MLLTTSIVPKVPNGLTQDPDQFLKLAPGKSKMIYSLEDTGKTTHDGHAVAFPRTIPPRPLVLCAR